MNDDLEADMDQGMRTYYEMVAAIVFQAIVLAVVGMLLTGEYVLFPISVAIGSGIAIGLLRHMLRTIDISLDLDSDTAKKYARRQAIVRLAFMGLALCVAFYYSDRVNPWGVLLGVFGLKFSAYLQPVIHKCSEIILMKRRVKGK